MFKLFRIEELPEKYYDFWINFINFKGTIKLLPMSFKKAWWNIILRQKTSLFLAIITKTLTAIFYTLVPIVIGWIFKNNYFYFTYLVIGWIICLFLEYLTVYYSAIVEIESSQSVQFSAYTFFLTVDPIHHTKRSTGKLFAKIERGSRAYEQLGDLMIYEVVPVIISVLTVIISLWTLSSFLGLLALGLLTAISILNILLTFLSSRAFEQKVIDADDVVKTLSLESLAQIQLIRASFASNEIEEEARDKNYQLMYKQATFWLAFSAVNLITKILYVVSIYFIGITIINYIQQGSLEVVLGITLILTYIRGTNETIQVGRKIRLVLKSLTRIKDLFSFINNFGEQTFPVLETSPNTQAMKALTASQDAITLEAENITFEYSPQTAIFDNHFLKINVPLHQENKLYGIIGPSGSGKTTLAAILGGQLKPTTGTILLNDIDIYSLGDQARRSLIALQGQVASTLSGTLRDNLLLGLPKDGVYYTDDQLEHVLENVGLWKMFNTKEGLNTFIGESGFTLSGGQRQRLNFANLYLRARYFKPLLILIDEPTSSLDEVSERAITDMIDQLAENSLTLVIAHRIKTLESALGIIDFSLLQESKQIEVYKPEELLKKSNYYRKLIHGEEPLQ